MAIGEWEGWGELGQGVLSVSIRFVLFIVPFSSVYQDTHFEFVYHMYLFFFFFAALRPFLVDGNIRRPYITRTNLSSSILVDKTRPTST